MAEGSAEREAVQMAELSSKYSEAQRNAQKAMALYKDTQDENEVLKSNFEALKQAYQTLQGRVEKDRQAARTAQDELAKVVSEREMQFTQWRAELEIKSKQFEELKDQVIPPHELEEIRFRMAEELDLPNREKCAALEAELERSREDYFQLRRTVEKLKIEKDQLHAEHEQNMMEAAEKHRAIENELNIRISALQVALEDTTEAEELHNLQRELAASRLREKNLLQELAEVRTAKESMRVAVERAGQETRDQVESVQGDLRKRDFQMEELRRKVAHIERELHQEVEGHQRTEAQLLVWERENGALRRKVDDLEEASRQTTKAQTKEREEERASWMREVAQLRKDIDEARRERQDAAAAHDAARSLAEEEYQRRLKALKEEHARRIMQAEDAERKLEAELSQALSDAKNGENDLRSQLAEAQQREEAMRHQAESAEVTRREAQDAASRAVADLRAVQDEADARSKACDEVDRQLARTTTQLEQALRAETACSQEKGVLEEAMAQLKTDFAELSKNVEAERVALRAQIYKAQEDAGALVRHSETALKTTRAELHDMKGKAKKFRAAAKKIKEQSKLRLAQLVKQLKAQDAAVGKLREMLAQADDRHDAAQAQAAQKLHATQRRVEELQLVLAERGGGNESGTGSAAAVFDSSEGSGKEEPATRGGLHVDTSSPTPGDGESRSGARASARESGLLSQVAAAAGQAGRRQLTALPRAAMRKDEP